MDKRESPAYPLHVTRALEAARKESEQTDANGQRCHEAVMRLVDCVVYYLGAMSVAQYSQALYTGEAEADPTLNRSLRSLRRLLPGQWLGWTARGLAATPNGAIAGLAQWYTAEGGSEIARAYEGLRATMIAHLAYTGEYGPRESVSPRLLLELVDQYRVRRSKAAEDALPGDFDTGVAMALLPGLEAIVANATFMVEYQLYAPQQRQLLMGARATTPMPPIPAPADAEATILLYPPGELPDYTKRPNLQAERVPLFPLDPLLVYIRCSECDQYRIAALREVAGGTPTYVGLDPECGHTLHG